MKKLILLISLVAFVACTSDSSGSGSDKDKYVSLGALSSSQWTYVSLTTGKVVGTSTFNSATEDSLWKKRGDWDLALCGSRMRTNGGTSGEGKGGVLKVMGVSYEGITEPSAQTFTVDSAYRIIITK